MTLLEGSLLGPITLPISEKIHSLLLETEVELIKTQITRSEDYIEIPFMELFAA